MPVPALHAQLDAALVPQQDQLTVQLVLLSTLSPLILVLHAQVRPILRAEERLHVLLVLLDALPALVVLHVLLVNWTTLRAQPAAPYVLQVSFQLEAKVPPAVLAPLDVSLVPAVPQRPALLVWLIMAILQQPWLALLVLQDSLEGRLMPALHARQDASLALRQDQPTVLHVLVDTS